MNYKEIIESSLDEKTIMEYYYGTPLVENKSIYRNITRNDNTGTCNFFWRGTRYYLYDYKMGTCVGVYDVVQHLYGCSFNEALKYIIRDFNINTNISEEDLKASKNYILNNYADKTKEDVTRVFRYRRRSLNYHDEAYFSRFEINTSTLEKFDVYPVDYVEIYQLRNLKFNKLYEYNHKIEDIKYVIKIKDKLRFYKPLSKIKSQKWIGNTDKECVFGLNSLDESKDVIFIASGIKDLMCLYEMGFTGIAPMSEPTDLPSYMIDKLKKLKSKGKRIIYLYDTDLAGLKQATKYSIKHGFEAIWLPKIEGLNLKDVADYVEYFNKENTKTIINTLLNE